VIFERVCSWPLLALLAALPSLAARLGGHSLAWRDTANLYAPIRSLVTEALRSGRLPLWNPYEATGKPLFAEALHGVLHPVSLLAALLDPGGVDLMIGLYLVAAAVGTFALTRELGLERPQAFLAGAAYSLSGFVLSMTGNLVFLAGAASVPWQVAAVAATGRGARFGVPAAAVTTAVTVLSGDAQMAIVAALLGGAMAAARQGWRGAGRAAGATLLGGLLASVQILPALAAIEASPRSLGLADIERAKFALAPWRVLEAAIPGLFLTLEGSSTAVFRWLGGPQEPGQVLPFSPSIYLGLPVLALAAMAPRADRTVKLLIFAAVTLLWLALGHFAGAEQALARVPVWGLFRYSEKMVAPLTLVIALLAAFGARGTDGAGPGRRPLQVAALTLAAVAVLARALAAALTDAPEEAHETLVANLSAGLPHVLGGAAAILVAAAIPRGRAWRSATLVGSVAATLLAALPFSRVLMPLAACAPWPGALVAEPPGPRVLLPYLSTAVAYVADIGRSPPVARVMLHDTCGLARSAAPAANVRARVDSFGSYGGLGSLRQSLLLSALPESWAVAARYFSVTHVSALMPRDDGERRQLARATSGGERVARDPEYAVELYTVPHAPWARFPQATDLAPGVEAAIQSFARAVESGVDVAVVEAGRAVPPGRGTVLSVRREPERVSVQFEADAGGLLVVNDAFWPGWTARIDGREAPMLPTNVIARGVEVPAGRHTLTMSYEPPGLRVGCLLSVLGLLACSALAAREARRRRTRPAP
jgi:hypothetical protein